MLLHRSRTEINLSLNLIRLNCKPHILIPLEKVAITWHPRSWNDRVDASKACTSKVLPMVCDSSRTENNCALRLAGRERDTSKAVLEEDIGMVGFAGCLEDSIHRGESSLDKRRPVLCDGSRAKGDGVLGEVDTSILGSAEDPDLALVVGDGDDCVDFVKSGCD